MEQEQPKKYIKRYGAFTAGGMLIGPLEHNKRFCAKQAKKLTDIRPLFICRVVITIQETIRE